MAKRFLAIFVVILFIFAAFLVISVGVEKPQPANAQSCPTPATPQNVLVTFPNCVGNTCSFVEANCTWSSVSGATNYQITVTEVETGTVVKNEQDSASVTSIVFPVNQNKTYKCDVSAINSCGTSGAAGSYSLLCAVDAAVTTTPAPTSPPQVACGLPCTSSAGCQSGYVCAVGSSGQGYCAIPSLQSACQSTPSVSACCSVPTVAPKPTVPATGVVSDTIIAGFASFLLLAAGVIFFVL